jgi:hypothetical protein
MSTFRRQDDAGGKEQEDTMAVEGVGRGNIVPIEALRVKHAARERDEAAALRTPGAGVGDGASQANGDAAEAQRTAGARRAAEARPRSAEERARLVDRFKSETADLPEVRRDKVIEAKVRISTGYYNRDEVRREVLRSVLANLLPPPLSAGHSQEAPAETRGEPAVQGGSAPAPLNST